MVDKNKIRLMTKLSLHEKQYNNKDKKINEYYRNDYIYKKNAINRIYIFVGLCLISLLMMLDMFYVKEIDILTLDYKALAFKFVIIFFLIMIGYTIIGMFKYGKEYDEAQKRYKRYFSMLNVLDKKSIEKTKGLDAIDGGSDERDVSH